MKFSRFGHKAEHIDPRIPIERSRSRHYYFGALVLGALTTAMSNESYERLNSGDQMHMLVGGALAFVSFGGAIATAGCIQSAEDHRKEVWRINDELRREWHENEQ